MRAVDLPTVDRYELIELIGKGGMGAVYRARHRDMGREVALKLIHPGTANDAALRRFRREMRTASAIRHPNVVQVHDFGETPDGEVFLAMELVAGESLWSRLKRDGRLPVETSCQVAIQVLRALGAAHAAGVVHRDLKPDNIMIASDSAELSVRVLDFGIARFFEEGKHTASMRVTRAGMFVGTAHYASPEQASGREIDGRSDLYAVGVLLFRMVVGRLPFDAPNQPLAILRMHLDKPPPRPSSELPGVPAWLDALILRLLAKEPEGRYASADEVIRALEAGLRGEALPEPTLQPQPVSPAEAPAPSSQPVGALVVGAATVAAVIAGLVGWWLGSS